MIKINTKIFNQSDSKNKKPLKIGFVGASTNVGLTELSSCFAIWLSENYFLNYNSPSVAYIQLAPLEDYNSNFFARYSISRYIDKNEFVDIYADLLIDIISKYESNFSVNKFPNACFGVNWLVPGNNFYSLISDIGFNSTQNIFTDEIYSLSSKILSITDTSHVIYNLGRGIKKEKLLRDMDILIAVSSASRNSIEHAYEDINSIETFRTNGGPFLWIVNGYTKGLQKSFVREKLKGGNIQFLKKIEPELLMNCNYNRIFLCEDNEIKPELWNFYNSIFKNFEKFIY